MNKVICGDVLEELGNLSPESVNLVITSPPYYQQRDTEGIGNEKTVDEYIESLLGIFGEVLRVVNPTGSIVFNLGDKYVKSSLLLVPYRFAIKATEKYPVRLVNDITWTKTNPTPRQYKKRLVPSTESFFHFTKGKDYYYNRDAFCMKEAKLPIGKRKPTSRLGKKYRSLIAKAILLNQKQKESANHQLDLAIQEVREGKMQDFRMKILGIHALPYGGGGGRSSEIRNKGFSIVKLYGKPLKRDVVSSSVETIPGNPHNSVFPLSVVKELILLLSQPSDLVLDPFAGSGTTLLGAKELGRQYLGIDINASYCKLARQRIRE